MYVIFTAVFVLSIISLICGSLLGYASRTFMVKEDPLIDQIDNILPQSQCGQCGHPGCRPYAQAVSQNNEMINKCIPGGKQTMLKIAEILNIDPQPLSDTFQQKPQCKIAFIHEDRCIGCMKCIKICPVDAIIGAKRTMHTVVSDICTGCNLCIHSCPTNCIEMCTNSSTTITPYINLSEIPVEKINLVHKNVEDFQ
ncbi:electron transport complex subunit RsxB [Candidatus Erwinia haradaeae]|uniref:Ion-translocating oxidoreductase complex subunit B n=1 Tax=Candidatus Erwinia haradaeae TaxID=1922217 RepID=A0A451D1J6_9GAMM|nr:electron transport complex subunit RsxB [Candidatus Erwinia haradaeae]VFP79486.1 Electron transport complex subunit RsxB [Candidatus Erwinia haradaeae]